MIDEHTIINAKIWRTIGGQFVVEFLFPGGEIQSADGFESYHDCYEYIVDLGVSDNLITTG